MIEDSGKEHSNKNEIKDKIITKKQKEMKRS
jgi:hypothetical protein